MHCGTLQSLRLKVEELNDSRLVNQWSSNPVLQHTSTKSCRCRVQNPKERAFLGIVGLVAVYFSETYGKSGHMDASIHHSQVSECISVE